MPSGSFTPEQMHLLEAAQMAWERRRKAKGSTTSFGEESVTETILQDLAEALLGTVQIIQFPKVEEGHTGADWAWVFRNAAGDRNFPMLVQAKALDLQDIAYPGLDKLVGKSTVRQIDRLLERSADWGWPALYAFYNHLSLPARIPDHCMTVPDAGATLPSSWGVSVADAQAVRSGVDLKDKTFDTHRLWSAPLHCLLCSQGRGVRADDGSPGQAREAVARLRKLGRGSEAGRDFDVTPSLEPIRSELPLLFRAALAAVSEADPRGEAAQLRALAKEYGGVQGVVIIRDDKEERPSVPGRAKGR